ncbi:MFS transporter [Mycobacterium sp. CVI_P3]|uniref:MFS transporter n=1 Tax=Mycobacterium pinniadriaticum TaxID=2994102 RepID=A0ABT3SK62_9MYCO|nr:MFS transporter [Mycobacterium pinniadriaticum]MCX2933445.1 MFS transporter [Mycobacterium pinniadriaticum]MCX2939916.1 MFS transporter [Mycobacterium pinniadriaticum]
MADRQASDRHDSAGNPPSLGRSLGALDGLNFFLADVQSGLGPFLGIYLLTVPGWNTADIGLVLTVGGLVGLAVQTPIGAFIDRTAHKRTLIIVAALATAVGAFLVTVQPSYSVITTAQVVTGVAGTVFPPAIAAVALGLVGAAAYTYRTGRMAAFNHAGNVVGAVVFGLAGYFITIKAGFWFAAAVAILVVVATLMINPKLIDNDVARGLTPTEPGTKAGHKRPSGFKVLLESRPLLALCAATMLWQLANGAMLPLSGQELALENVKMGTLFQAELIIVAQLVMIPMAIMIAKKGKEWGRKPIFLAAFLVLPLRGVMFTWWDEPYYIVSVQILDGIGAGIFGAMFVLVVADLTRGTGHFNLVLGAATTLQGIGAALSPTLAGFVAVAAGFHVALFVLSGIAVLALIVFVVGVPETANLPEAGVAVPVGET